MNYFFQSSHSIIINPCSSDSQYKKSLNTKIIINKNFGIVVDIIIIMRQHWLSNKKSGLILRLKQWTSLSYQQNMTAVSTLSSSYLVADFLIDLYHNQKRFDMLAVRTFCRNIYNHFFNQYLYNSYFPQLKLFFQQVILHLYIFCVFTELQVCYLKNTSFIIKFNAHLITMQSISQSGSKTSNLLGFFSNFYSSYILRFLNLNQCLKICTILALTQPGSGPAK